MQAWAARMFAQFENIKRKHRGETGRRREDDLREFLRCFFPRRLGIGTGEIAASDGSVSPQVDLIVYDALETPLLDSSESSIVVPVEGVFGVIEVSSRLDITKLREDVEKIRAVKALEKRAYWAGNSDIVNSYAPHGTPRDVWPVLGFCFAYEGNELDNLRAGVRQLDTDDLWNNLDMLCVLNQGCIANAGSDASGGVGGIAGAPSPNTSRLAIVNEGAGMGGALMFFYLLAGGLLMQARTAPINMARYLGRPDRHDLPR
jgi:hypothetical protein